MNVSDKPSPPTVVGKKRYLRGCAWVLLWLFALFTLGSVAMAVKSQFSTPGNTFRMYYVRDGDRVVQAWGLTYSGVSGRVLAVCQAAAVIGMLAAVTRRRWRAIGLGLLMAWAVLWVVGVGRVTFASAEWVFFGPWFALTVLGLLATLVLLTTAPPPRKDGGRTHA
jgi:hypothetical protein